MTENILERAARVFEQAEKRKALSGRDEERLDARRVLRQARALSLMLTVGIRKLIMEEAQVGNNCLVVMGMTTDRTKKEVGGGLDSYYDSTDPVNRQAFDLVFKRCERLGLSPQREYDDTYYGESIDPIETIKVKWGPKR